MGSLDRNIVSQLQEEMDELHHMQYSTDFSTDVNRKMQVPPRLSMEPESGFMDSPSPTPDLGTDMENSPAHAMSVPERILIAGSDQHVGVRQTPRDLDLDNMAPFPQPGSNVGLTTPPRTLTLDEISFPTVGDAKSAAKKKPANNAVRISGDTDSGVQFADGNSSLVESTPLAEWEQLQRRVYLLTSTVASLEEAERRRDRREKIFMMAGIVYFFFKGLRFLFRSPYQ
ncbi:mitochondrial fission factor-like [Diadema antillarum]|uniref:mitochondrial fission factor-like n=1 Tax=Diadema antillarum TaxID=105358 RepID=UPI003A848E73